MAQFYTLEEAARVLGMSPDELKQKAQQREVRAFLDSGSWRFRVADIDELARRRGMGSDPDLSLSDLDLEIPSDSGSEELLLSEFQIGAANPELKAQSVETAKPPTGGEEILLDDMTVPPHPVTGSSSVIIGMEGTGKLPSDSDVKLVPEISRGASDSDVRLASPPPLKASDSDVKLVGQGRPSDSDIKLAPLGELPKVSGEQPKSSDSDVTLVSDDSSSSFEVARPSADAGQRSGSGETMIARSPLLGSSGEVPATAPEEDSDFELTPSSVIDALQPESGSDFELTALDSSSDDFESSPLLAPSESDVTGAQPSASGINLGRPSDSGINLQQVGSLNLDSESIELAPLEEDEPPAQKAPPKPAAKPAPKPAAAEKKKVDLSATALPIKGEKDIFEDTDFEVDALDSGESSDDRTVQLEAASDFDLEDSDSASEVFAIDEEDVDQNAATAMAPAVLEEEADEFAAEAESGETPSAWDVEEAVTSAPATRAATAPVLAPAGPAAEWGTPWVVTLGVATLFMMLLAFVGMDLVRNLYEYRGDVPIGSGLVKFIASNLGG